MWTTVPSDWDGQLDALNAALERRDDRWEATCLDTPTLLREIEDWSTAGRNAAAVKAKPDWQSLQGEVKIIQDPRTHGPRVRRLVSASLAALLQVIVQNDREISALPAIRALQEILGSEECIVAAWDDLVESAENLRQDVEAFRRRRNEFIAIARLGGTRLGHYGQAPAVTGILADQQRSVASAIREKGRIATASVSLSDTPLFGMPKAERLLLAREVWRTKPSPTRNIVWLTYLKAPLPQGSVALGPVSYYTADHLYSLISTKDPELPKELHSTGRSLTDWVPEPEFGITLARVDVGNTRESTAIADAIQLSSAMLDVFGGSFERSGWELQARIHYFASTHTAATVHDADGRSIYWAGDPTGTFLADAQLTYSSNFEPTSNFRRIIAAYSALRLAQRE